MNESEIRTEVVDDIAHEDVGPLPKVRSMREMRALYGAPNPPLVPFDELPFLTRMRVVQHYGRLRSGQNRQYQRISMDPVRKVMAQTRLLGYICGFRSTH